MAENSTTEKSLNRAEQAMAAAIDALLSFGFTPDGETREEMVRIPTKKSPLYGCSGGELVKLGGRQRFALGDTNLKATVGKRTLAVYRIDGKGLAGVRGIASLDTSDLDRLSSVLASLPQHL